jgi:hypothetical protein
MPLKFVRKESGYAFRMLNPRHSQKYWNWLKNYLDDESLFELRCYQRAPMNLELLYKSLSKYDVISPRKSNDVHMDVAEKWVRSAFIPKTKMPLHPLYNVKQIELPQGTNAGLPYMRDFKNKGLAWDSAYADAAHILDIYIKGGRYHFPPCAAFCRSKVVKRSEPKIRFIFGVSLVVLILQLMFFKPIWDYMKSGKTPAAYKNTLYYGGYPSLLYEMDEKKVSFNHGGVAWNTDFSNYDTSCGAWLTRRTYDIMHDMLDFENFEDGEWNDNVKAYETLFYDLMRHDIDTEVLMPDGMLWKKSCGDSTGSRAFQPMQNIRTCFMIQAAFHKQNGKTCKFMKSLGDDCIFADVACSFDFNEASNYIETKFGPCFNTSKCIVAKTSNELNFLGRDYRGLNASRKMVDVVLSILYPENENDNDIFLYQRLVAMYYENAGGDSRVDNMLRKAEEIIDKDLRKSLNLGIIPPMWTNYQLKIFERLGLDVPPKLKFPSRMFIFFLVTFPKKDMDWSYLQDHYQY